jgi:hypothetical protein
VSFLLGSELWKEQAKLICKEINLKLYSIKSTNQSSKPPIQDARPGHSKPHPL